MKTKFLYISLILSTLCIGQTLQSEEILVFNDSIELPGTLTYSKENTPLIIWVHGSGNVDRNGNQGSMIKANYIKQFRDSINKNDIALSYFNYLKEIGLEHSAYNLIFELQSTKNIAVNKDSILKTLSFDTIPEDAYWRTRNNAEWIKTYRDNGP